MPRLLEHCGRAILFGTVLITLLAGCGSDKKPAASGSSAATTSSSSRSTSSSSSSPSATSSGSSSTSSSSSSSSSSPANADQGPGYFQLPSKNVGCIFGDGKVRCDISGKTWSPPPQPASCDLDWGNGIEVGDGAASIVCAGDTALGGPDVLEYGLSAQRGNLRCDAAETGVTCKNLKTSHGFELNRDGFRLF